MFIAHLPAGCCLTTILLFKFVQPENERTYRRFLWTGLCASVMPDLDLIYFYLIDHRQHPHHTYITHIPFFWLAGAIWLWFCGAMFRQRFMMWSTLIIFTNGILHLFLDSVASKVLWLYPLFDDGLGLFHVPSRYSWWVWNYVFHWTFGLEIMIVVAAGYLLYYKRNSGVFNGNPRGKMPSCG